MPTQIGYKERKSTYESLLSTPVTQHDKQLVFT